MPQRCQRAEGHAWTLDVFAGAARRIAETCIESGRGLSVLARRSEPAALQGDQGKLHSTCTGRGAAWLARQSGGLEVPGSSPGAPTVTNVLQKWLDRLLGRGARPAAPGPTRDPNEQEYLSERQRKLLDESVLDARRFDPPSGG